MSRPVWLTEAEVHGYELGIVELAALVRERWDAAPADAVSVITNKLPLGEYAVTQSIWAHEIARALGRMPER